MENSALRASRGKMICWCGILSARASSHHNPIVLWEIALRWMTLLTLKQLYHKHLVYRQPEGSPLSNLYFLSHRSTMLVAFLFDFLRTSWNWRRYLVGYPTRRSPPTDYRNVQIAAGDAVAEISSHLRVSLSSIRCPLVTRKFKELDRKRHRFELVQLTWYLTVFWLRFSLNVGARCSLSA